MRNKTAIRTPHQKKTQGKKITHVHENQYFKYFNLYLSFLLKFKKRKEKKKLNLGVKHYVHPFSLLSGAINPRDTLRYEHKW